MFDAISRQFCLAVSNEQTALGTRHGNIELASILVIELLVVTIVIVGDAAINDIKDDDVVKLQPLGLVMVETKTRSSIVVEPQRSASLNVLSSMTWRSNCSLSERSCSTSMMS